MATRDDPLWEIVDNQVLGRLDLPQLQTSPQGFESIVLHRELVLAYVVNPIERTPLRTNATSGIAVPAAGVRFTVPSSSRYIIDSIRWAYTATATVGTRNLAIIKRDKADHDVSQIASFSTTASQTV